MRSGFLAVAAALLLVSTPPALALDIEAGGKIYQKDCRACHGRTGKGLSSYPKLAGKSNEHLTDLLEQYRAGKKIGPNTALMAPRAKKLSDDDIKNIVGYIVETF